MVLEIHVPSLEGEGCSDYSVRRPFEHVREIVAVLVEERSGARQFAVPSISIAEQDRDEFAGEQQLLAGLVGRAHRAKQAGFDLLGQPSAGVLLGCACSVAPASRAKVAASTGPASNSTR
ncbi:hypothetical protein ACFWN7_06215 [Agromyces sp. NPDC058484]|uniref:hypothetical protein n=1 Tax=Agromyces sp. NPDC058484 TaxID=3346524 RepID=UPI003648D9AC